MAQRANLLLLRVCGEQGPDWETSRADARAALSLAHDVPLEFIDSLGYDCTDAAYADVRASWVRHVEMFGWHDQFDRPQLDQAHGHWLASRPDLAAGDDWLADCWLAHLARYPEGACDAARYAPDETNVMGSRCDICQPFTLLYEASEESCATN